MHPNEHCNCRYADVGCDRMEQVMDQISGKWKMRILFMVGAHGTLRYGELRKLLDGVTHKMLSNQLKRSEERRVGKECRSRWSPYH